MCGVYGMYEYIGLWSYINTIYYIYERRYAQNRCTYIYPNIKISYYGDTLKENCHQLIVSMDNVAVTGFYSFSSAQENKLISGHFIS